MKEDPFRINLKYLKTFTSNKIKQSHLDLEMNHHGFECSVEYDQTCSSFNHSSYCKHLTQEETG